MLNNQEYEVLAGALRANKYLRYKRWIDIILILVSLPLTLLVMLITAIVIRLESKGPVIFIQKRVGLNGEEFDIYKFRSMCTDSEKEGAKFAGENDDRVTNVGKFIRKMRIDELPQLLNVLKGDMSLIGPRPEQKVFVDKFSQKIPLYDLRHLVRPGISGYAQVTQGYTASTDETREKLDHDLYYIRNLSFSLDLLIFFKTLHTMLTGFGAR